MLKEITKETNALDAAQVGDGITSCHYSDRKAGTIIKRTDKKIWMQRDKAKIQNGVNSGAEDALHFAPGGFVGHTSGKQRYEYERDEKGSVTVFSRREWTNTYDSKTYVRWIEVGSERHNGTAAIAGRHEFYDYNF